MSYRIARIANVIGPGQVAVSVMDHDWSDARLLETSRWLLEYHDPATGFGPCRHGERLLGLGLGHGSGEGLLVARFSHLCGVYRLTCLDEGVHPAWNRCLFHGDPQGREPLYLRIEGVNLHGDNIIHACYLDPGELPGSLSWQVDQEQGLCLAGGFSIRLVDLDGDLTAAFTPRLANRPVARLALAATPQDTVLHLDDASGLAASGIVHIGREAIAYGTVNGNALESCQRAALATTAQAHRANQRLFAANPHLLGRRVWVRRPRLAANPHEPDPLIFCGLLERIGPDPENLAAYRLELSDPLAHMNTAVGSRLGGGFLTQAVMVDGEETVNGRRGNDRFCFAYREHPALAWEVVTVAIAPGGYRAEPGHGTQGHIAHVLREALESAAPGLFTSVFVDEAGKLHLRVRVGDAFRLLAGERPEIDKDSILPTLGFDLSRTQTLHNSEGAIQRPGEGLELMELVGQHPIRGGLGLHNRKVFLALDPLSSESVSRFAGGKLVRIDDEIIYYEKLGLDPQQDAPSATLTYPLDATDTVLRSDNVSDFPEDGGFVAIGNELVRYRRREGSVLLVGCIRGVWDSRAAAHSPGSSLRLVSQPYLSGCLRGLYDTLPSVHAEGATVSEILSSDRLSQPLSGHLRREPVSPLVFLMDLLDATRPHSRAGLDFGPLLDAADIQQLADEMPLSFGESFQRVVLPDELFGEVISEICRSTGLVLGVNGAGRLTLFRPRPMLLHEAAQPALTHADLLAPPVIHWLEDLRVNRVEVLLDYHPIHGRHATRLVVDDDRGGFSADELERTLRIESRSLKSSRLGDAQAGGDGWGYDLAWRLLRRRNRFVTGLSLECPLALAEGLAPLDGLRISSPALAGGDGTRGMANALYRLVELERDLAANRARLGLLEQDDRLYGGLSLSFRVVSWEAASLRLVLGGEDFWPEELDPSMLAVGDCLSLSRTDAAGNFWLEAAMSLAAVDLSDWDDAKLLAVTLAASPALTPTEGDLVSAAAWEFHAPDSALRQFIHLTTPGVPDAPDFRYAP